MSTALSIFNPIQANIQIGTRARNGFISWGLYKLNFRENNFHCSNFPQNFSKCSNKLPSKRSKQQLVLYCSACTTNKNIFKSSNQAIVITWKGFVFGDFLVHIFPHSDWLMRDTEYLSAFSPKAGKYAKERLRIRTLFTQCVKSWNYNMNYNISRKNM